MGDIRRDTNRQDARFIVEHELYKESFKAVEDDIFRRMRSIDVTDIEHLQSTAMELQLLNKVEGALTRHIMTGDIADFNEALSNKVK